MQLSQKMLQYHGMSTRTTDHENDLLLSEGLRASTGLEFFRGFEDIS